METVTGSCPRRWNPLWWNFRGGGHYTQYNWPNLASQYSKSQTLQFHRNSTGFLLNTEITCGFRTGTMSCFIKSKGDPRKPKAAKKKKKSVHWFCLAPADGLPLLGPSVLHHQAELVRQSSRSKPLPMLVLRIRWQMSDPQPGVWEAEGHINTASLHIYFFILNNTRYTAPFIYLFIYLVS